MIWCGSSQHVPPTSPFLGRPPPLLCWLCVKRVGHGGARCNLIWTVPFPAWHNVFLWIGLRFPYIINFDECVIWLYHFQKSLQASLPFQLDFFFLAVFLLIFGGWEGCSRGKLLFCFISPFFYLSHKAAWKQIRRSAKNNLSANIFHATSCLCSFLLQSLE